MPERIHKVLANAGIGSRRSIERWVAEGRITVDGRVAKLGEQLQGRERVCFDGKPIRLTAAKLARAPHDGSLAYYKPGATRGAAEDKAALDLPRPRHGPLDRREPARSQHVGPLRIDDGRRACEPAHASQHRRRARVRGPVARRAGGRADSAASRAASSSTPASLEVEKIEAGKGGGSNVWHHVTLREARHRDLRPMLAAVGLAVSRVIRVRYGDVALGELYRGASRPLSPAETKALYAPRRRDAAPQGQRELTVMEGST